MIKRYCCISSKGVPPSHTETRVQIQIHKLHAAYLCWKHKLKYKIFNEIKTCLYQDLTIFGYIPVAMVQNKIAGKKFSIEQQNTDHTRNRTQTG